MTAYLPVPQHPAGEPLPTCGEVFVGQLRTLVADVGGRPDGIYFCAPGATDWEQVGTVAETVQDIVGALLVDSTTIDFTYNDATPSLTATAIYGTTTFVEAAQDAIGAALLDTATIDLTYNDATNQISADAIYGTTAFVEAAQDAVGAALTDSSSIDFTYSDGANTITAAAIFGTTSGTVAQGNHTHDHNAITDFTEAAQDAVGAALANSNSITLTYTDLSEEIKAAAVFGTTGTTVAVGNHGHALTITERTNTDGSVPTGNTGTVTATCVGSEVATGGGSSMTGNDALHWVVTSRPGAGESWTAAIYNNTGSSQSMTAYVMCLNQP